MIDDDRVHLLHAAGLPQPPAQVIERLQLGRAPLRRFEQLQPFDGVADLLPDGFDEQHLFRRPRPRARREGGDASNHPAAHLDRRREGRSSIELDHDGGQRLGSRGGPGEPIPHRHRAAQLAPGRFRGVPHRFPDLNRHAPHYAGAPRPDPALVAPQRPQRKIDGRLEQRGQVARGHRRGDDRVERFEVGRLPAEFRLSQLAFRNIASDG